TWGGAKRVRVEPKWRIGEIEVGVKEEDNAGELGMGGKRAIQERRKSALSFCTPAKALESPARAYVALGRSVSAVNAPLTPHSEEDEEDTRSLLDRMKHDDLEEDAETAGTERHADAEENTEDDSEDDQQAGEEEENSDKENGRASPVRPPSSHGPKPDVSETSHHMPTPLSPTRIALDLDLEVEKTPLTQLTRPTGTSRRQHTNAFSGPQTPTLTSVKHLFSPPAVKSMRALFRGAGKGAEMGIREEALDGVEEMMLMPDGYRARDKDVPEQVIAEEHEQEEQERTRVAEKEEEERKPVRATSQKTPVPPSAPITTAARRRTTRTVVGTGVTGSNAREFSTSRPVARTEPVPSKRAQMVLPNRAEKEKEKATAVAPELESEPAPGVLAEERDEVATQLAVQKKPVKAGLLRARKGVATETSGPNVLIRMMRGGVHLIVVDIVQSFVPLICHGKREQVDCNLLLTWSMDDKEFEREEATYGKHISKFISSLRNHPPVLIT
ncbi:hypothetical protein AZE42_10269, partial [Rhizopogon vesiculosus]